MFDILLNELLTLNSRLESVGISLILGGGMGLFLRDTYLGGERSPRYPVRPESRSTEDLDVLLTADLIVDAARMNQLRDVLNALSYKDVVKHFQFERRVDFEKRVYTVKVDLLAAPPAQNDEDLVTIKSIRIRPKASKDIHGYLTKDAAGIEIGKVPINVRSQTGQDSDNDTIIQIPSSFNYLVLKLHAFHDRKDRTDLASDLGRHHAFDIFRIITDMREADWESAARHVMQDNDTKYLKNAAQYQRSYFGANTSLGILRLKENEGYRRRRNEFDQYIPDILADIAELFADVRV